MNKNRLAIYVLIVALALATLVTVLTLRSPTLEREPVSFVFTAAGDYGFNTNTDRVLNKIAEIAPDFHLTTGDFSYGKPGEEEMWCTYVKNHVGADFPFELISGNHESDGLNGLIDNFAKCLPNKLPGIVGEYGKQFYFDYPPTKPIARIILISPTLTFPSGETYDYSPGTERFLWLKNAIEQGKSAGLPWTIVVSHKDCISPGRLDCSVGSEVMNYLIGNADLILQSHSHVYMRSKQLRCIVGGSRGVVWSEDCVQENNLDNIVKKGNGAIAVSIGTGGQALRPVSENVGDESINYLGDYMNLNETTYGVLKIQVTEDLLRGDFVPALGEYKDTFLIQR